MYNVKILSKKANLQKAFFSKTKFTFVNKVKVLKKMELNLSTVIYLVLLCESLYIKNPKTMHHSFF